MALDVADGNIVGAVLVEAFLAEEEEERHLGIVYNFIQ
jgi:hypothetical protein